ncbi:hypothetical protein DFH94DRAFT_685024 [Russula ochroleuca]|uniref:Uncharacterized protein n=1 Tax=Russula ochroleuca TaxID=152965 RepID=A0A9P5MPF4_9AGAM|nr:hypothetical protein DFH94DRAFT_685024 [Russula ochroleuca]
MEKPSPLARYAAEYWVPHAQFEDVASCIRGIEDLFDPDRPYFAAWCQLYDIDTKPPHTSTFYQFYSHSKSGAITPLYYASSTTYQGFLSGLGRDDAKGDLEDEEKAH